MFGLTRDDLTHREQVHNAVRTLAARMPTYITLKDVKKRWGKRSGRYLAGGAV